MKRLIALIAIVALVYMPLPPLRGQAVVVKHTTSTSQIVQYTSYNPTHVSGTTATMTLHQATTAGTAYFGWAIFDTGAGGGAIGVTQTGAADTLTYTIQSTTGCATGQYSGTINCVLFYTCSGAGGLTALTFSNLINYNPLQSGFVEMSSVLSSSCLDSGSNSAFNRPGGTSTTWSSSSMTAAANDVLIGLAYANSNSATVGLSGSWVNANTFTGGGVATQTGQYSVTISGIQTGVSSGAHTFTGTVAPTNTSNAMLIGFKHS